MQRVKLTYEDYVAIPDDGKRHEIIDGDEYVTPSPRTRHQAASMNLSELLRAFVRRTKAGKVFAAPFDVVLSESDIVQPDLVFVSSSRLAIITEANIRGVPDLVVEILSEGNRRHDEILKKKRYELFGVNEYWIVDPELQTIKIYRLKDKAYGRAIELSTSASDALDSPLLPGFSAWLSDVFAL